jgi:hypothetical protein
MTQMAADDQSPNVIICEHLRHLWTKNQMSPAPEHPIPAAHSPRQFSLRSLFKLTVLAAILLTIGVVHSPWTPVTIALPLAVWFVFRAKLIRPRWLAHGSIAVFGVSLLLPAASVRIMGNPEIFMGWFAFAVSFSALPEVFLGDWLIREPDELHWAIAYTAGAAANFSFLTGYIAHFFAKKFPRAATYARRAAIVALVFACVSLVMLLMSLELGLIYPGYGCWVAAMLALYLGTRRSQSTPGGD